VRDVAGGSTPEDLALHGVRVLGYATTSRIAGRFRLDVEAVEEALLDYEARGWVRHFSFGGDSGWSLTDGGRVENERRLAAELERTGLRGLVTSVHAAFRPLNRRLGAACTDWQVRPSPLDPMARNDHCDPEWDERVLRTLGSLDGSFRCLCDRLAAGLPRFDGYADRYSAALRKAQSGHPAWVDASDRDSCHIVWIQFHEDLLATLGIPRGTDA
jgi:hypothetical protein